MNRSMPSTRPFLVVTAMIALSACAGERALSASGESEVACVAYGKVDADDDDRISRAEWNRYRGAFDSWDADDNGRIDRTEYRACVRVAAGIEDEEDQDGPLGIDWQEDDYGLHDADGDGLLDESEFWGVDSFDRTDADDNDWIEREKGEWDFPPPR